MQDLLPRLTSRKFLLAVLTAITAMLQAGAGNITPAEAMNAVVAVVVAFTAAEGLADALERKANAEAPIVVRETEDFVE